MQPGGQKFGDVDGEPDRFNKGNPQGQCHQDHNHQSQFGMPNRRSMMVSGNYALLC
jgi:hypothetical protein